MDKNKIVLQSVRAALPAAVALILIFTLFAPVKAGVSPEVGRVIGNASLGSTAIIGETNLSFVNASGVLISEGVIKSNWQDSHIIISFKGPFDSSEEPKLVEGEYKVEGTAANATINATISTIIYFVLPKLDANVKVKGEDFSWVTQGGNITFEAHTYLSIIKGPLPNNITYKLLDPDGLRVPEEDVGENVSLENIDVSENGENTVTINTSKLDTDTRPYRLSIETDPETNNGLDVEGPAVSFEVRSVGVEIKAKPEEQTVTEEIVFSVSTTPHTFISLNVTRGEELNVWFNEGAGIGEPKTGGHSAFGISDEDGLFKAVASFTETGNYDITATEHEVQTEDRISVKITVLEPELTGLEEGVYYIGEILEISGSADAGDRMTIKIDDDVFKENVELGDVYYLYTEDLSPGTHEIEMWVLPISDPETDLPDVSETIVLIRGGLFAETYTKDDIPTGFVARGDDFIVNGTVPGRDRVDILTIAPKGGGREGLNPDDIFGETDGKMNAPGLTHHTCGVTEDGEFKTTWIKANEDADTGTYLIPVLSYGRDRVWGMSSSDDLLSVLTNGFSSSLEVKTSEQILEILKDKTINEAGSDDLLGIVTIKVEEGFVELDELEDVVLGSELEVSGITNRKVEKSIIVTVEGLGENATKLKPKFIEIEEDEEQFYNKFKDSFETATAKVGEYLVTADDGDGHTATTTVRILPAVEPSVNVRTTPTPTPSPTPAVEGGNESVAAATPTPSPTPTPTLEEKGEEEGEEQPGEEQPGFEAAFCVAGLLLAVVWLRRKRTREREKKRNK